jgi:hypothetical protein
VKAETLPLVFRHSGKAAVDIDAGQHSHRRPQCDNASDDKNPLLATLSSHQPDNEPNGRARTVRGPIQDKCRSRP